jgi:hypothetical protein
MQMKATLEMINDHLIQRILYSNQISWLGTIFCDEVIHFRLHELLAERKQ